MIWTAHSPKFQKLLDPHVNQHDRLRGVQDKSIRPSVHPSSPVNPVSVCGVLGANSGNSCGTIHETFWWDFNVSVKGMH